MVAHYLCESLYIIKQVAHTKLNENHPFFDMDKVYLTIKTTQIGVFLGLKKSTLERWNNYEYEATSRKPLFLKHWIIFWIKVPILIFFKIAFVDVKFFLLWFIFNFVTQQQPIISWWMTLWGHIGWNNTIFQPIHFCTRCLNIYFENGDEYYFVVLFWLFYIRRW